jgi:hypothetical protein
MRPLDTSEYPDTPSLRSLVPRVSTEHLPPNLGPANDQVISERLLRGHVEPYRTSYAYVHNTFETGRMPLPAWLRHHLWSLGRDSNPHPHGYEPCAPPVELPSDVFVVDQRVSLSVLNVPPAPPGVNRENHLFFSMLSAKKTEISPDLTDEHGASHFERRTFCTYFWVVLTWSAAAIGTSGPLAGSAAADRQLVSAASRAEVH